MIRLGVANILSMRIFFVHVGHEIISVIALFSIQANLVCYYLLVLREKVAGFGFSPIVHLIIHLKRQYHEIFDLWFFHKSTAPRPLINTLTYFRILFRIRGAIRLLKGPKIRLRAMQHSAESRFFV
jgi:hypothetical protein